MPKVECCGHKRLATSYNIEPQEGFISCTLNIIYKDCPICKHFVLELVRENVQGEKQIIRKKNDEAYKLFDKLENSIINQIKNSSNVVAGSFWLGYSEYGKKKRCYSNLSTLKMGLTDNFAGVKDYRFLKAV